MQRTYEGGVFDPEAFRSMLARIRPEEIGLGPGVLNRFQLSVLTEGSGTQVFATTFVQWAAREGCGARNRSPCWRGLLHGSGSGP
jgi:hypothetical protein